MNHTIHLIGLNHRSAGVDVRERFALSDVETVNSKLLGGPLHEVMALSTCNRVDIVAVAENGGAAEHVLDAWAKACGQTSAELAPHVYTHSGDDAVAHLFCVAGSLDSMVLGEPQILGQLKDAYRQAVDEGTARVILNRLLHKAFFVAKRIRSETGVASSAVSISYAAVELAKRIFGDMTDKRAMLVGAGEMAELAAAHLLSAGVRDITVVNRTLERAKELAARFNGTPACLEDLTDHLQHADIVVSSTGATEPVLRARDMRGVQKKRRYRPMFLIDIAVPRDIDPDVNQLDNVYLYDIDDLKEVVEENQERRKDEADKARAIVVEEVSAFNDWLASLDLAPTIVDLLAKGDDMAQKELAKTLRRLGPVDDATRQALETLVTSLTRKLCHDPILFLKRRAQEEGKADHVIHMVRRIFNLDAESVPDDAHLNRKSPGGCPAKQRSQE